MAKTLVVDDNLLHGRTVLAAAQTLGHEALHVLTLDQGLRAAKENAWDVVFLDASLPDGDGLEAVARFSQTLPKAKLVAMIQEDQQGQAKAALKQGLNEFLVKPLAPPRIAAVLNDLDSAAPAASNSLPTLKDFRDQTERQYLEDLIAATDSDVVKALATAGISRAGYYNLLKKHGLTGAGREDPPD